MSTIAVEQVPVICWCGLAYSIPKSLEGEAHRSADDPALKAIGVYCPVGHTWVYEPSDEVKRLRDELTRAKSRLDQTQAHLETARRQVANRDRKLKRVERGTCPECKRHFVNVERHMKSKHATVEP